MSNEAVRKSGMLKNTAAQLLTEAGGYTRKIISLTVFPSSNLYLPDDLLSRISIIVFSVPTIPGETIRPMFCIVSSGVEPLIP